MPCLELKVALRQPEPASRLRALLEKPGAAVLRRNYVAEAPGHEDGALRSRLRVTAVLAVDLTNPPREADAAAEPHAEADPLEPQPPVQQAPDPMSGSFAKGLEIWLADGARSTCVHADDDEMAGALAMFDAYLRLARYQPAFQRLDQRVVGLSYLFREGLSVAIQGSPGEAAHTADASLESASAISETEDFRDPRFAVRLSNTGVGYFHDLLRSAAAWLDDNSYPNLLGSK
jgi:hypothetical protein